VLDDAILKGTHLGISAISLVEIAFLGESRGRLVIGVNDLFHQVDADPAFQILPITTDVAQEAAALAGALRDPGDCVIVATARVHRLTLLTSDQRIIDSHLVPVVE
jgi:PIN domain nuclease of toxin-antitoxin system